MDLHIFFLPFLSPGHMIPMVDLAKSIASHGVTVTVVTTSANEPRIKPTLDRSPHKINLLILPFPTSTPQNILQLPTPDFTPEFIVGLNSLKPHLDRLLAIHKPDCIVSDVFYPWTSDLAKDHNIPRVAFHGSSPFIVAITTALAISKPQEKVKSEDEMFVVPGLPHRVEMCKSQLMGAVIVSEEFNAQIIQSFMNNMYANVMNTFHDMDPGYTETYHKKTWLVGPVSLCNSDTLDRATRGGVSEEFDRCLNWLDAKRTGSVLYICFGSLGRFTNHQLREMAEGLAAAGHPFVWVIRDAGGDWMPEGFEEKGLIVKGWAPQAAILNHEAVGGFVTHCGWNSCLEGASAGVPIVTWPLFADQFMNEKLLVDVLRIGVSVGSLVNSSVPEGRTLVSREEVRKAVEEVMGRGEEAEERRKRAKEVAEKARNAVAEGGSSYNEMCSMIQDLRDVKAGKVALA